MLYTRLHSVRVYIRYLTSAMSLATAAEKVWFVEELRRARTLETKSDISLKNAFKYDQKDF